MMVYSALAFREENKKSIWKRYEKTPTVLGHSGLKNIQLLMD